MSADSGQSQAAELGMMPGPQALPRRTIALTLIGLLMALLLGFMDVTIVATAGPTIVSDLGGISLYAWVFSSFIIVQTIVIPIFGKLSDIYGRKTFFLFGLAVFMFGSTLSGASQNIYELIAFRALQGVGFGAFLPTTIAIAGDMFPPAQRGRIQGLLFSINGVAFAVAPAAGSYLTEVLNWRWIFYVNLPIGVASFLVIFFALKRTQTSGTGFSDWAGAATLSGLLGLFTTSLFVGGSTFPWESWQEAALFLGSLVFLAGFVAVERRAKEPVLPPHLFRIRNVSATTGVNILRAMVLFGLIVYLPLYAQVVLAGTVTDVRNVIYTFALPATAGFLVSGAVLPRVGPKRTILAGALIVVFGLIALRYLSATSQLIQLMELSVAPGFGSGLMVPASIVSFQNSVRRNELGVASGLAAFTLNLGGAIGVAVLGAIQTNVFSSKLSSLLAGAPLGTKVSFSDPNTVGQILASPQALSRVAASNPAFAALVPQLRDAFSQSILILLTVLSAASVLVILAGLLLKGRSQGVAEQDSPAT